MGAHPKNQQQVTPTMPQPTGYVEEYRYSGDQIRFLRSVQEVFLQKRRLTGLDLYELPVTIFGRNAVEGFFRPTEIEDLLALMERCLKKLPSPASARARRG